MQRLLSLILSLFLLFASFFGISDVTDTTWESSGWSASSVDLGDYTITLQFEKNTYIGQLTDTTWELSGWPASSVDLGNYTITLQFKKDTYISRKAVNCSSGEYKAYKDGRLDIVPMYTTAMGGTPEAMRAERIYGGLLGSVKKYTQSSSVLTLFDENSNELLIYKKAD